MKSKTFDELAKEAVDDVLSRIEINGIPFRDFIEKLGNANENKDCNLTSCEYNSGSCCTNQEERKHCVTVSKSILGI
jgi:hypothetical protein